MDLLVEGGYMIGTIASLLFKDPVLVDEPDHDKAVALTNIFRGIGGKTVKPDTPRTLLQPR